MTAARRASWWLGAAGLLLAAGLLVAAQPRAVFALAARAHPSGIAMALAFTCALAALRGARLRLLVGRDLRPPDSVAVVTAAQLAATVLPLRLGELALLPLLRAAGVPGTLRGLSVLVVARVLDLLSVLVWAIVAGGLAGGSPAVAALVLLAFAAAIAAGAAIAVRRLRGLALRWRRRAGWRRRSLTQLLRVRRELARVVRSPRRAAGIAALSLSLWVASWLVTWALVRAIGLPWSPLALLVGVVGAGIGSALPVNFVGSFGSQEAGWTAALAGIGVEPRAALVAGFACHLWSLGFNGVLGLAGAARLAARQPESSRRPFLAILRSLLASGRAA